MRLRLLQSVVKLTGSLQCSDSVLLAVPFGVSRAGSGAPLDESGKLTVFASEWLRACFADIDVGVTCGVLTAFPSDIRTWHYDPEFCGRRWQRLHCFRTGFSDDTKSALDLPRL